MAGSEGMPLPASGALLRDDVCGDVVVWVIDTVARWFVAMSLLWLPAILNEAVC